ncbi:MAG TPA: molybdopterin-dependent oxidoreductase [Tenuifilaceae bacterium]|nr:molybdopterin-dependent oxidoreductase [Tenuifilaceae bacterium]HPN20820.1 molybdopterin-dependent oxidoreductase [Tenuifilaceae bacterium]
MKEFVTACPRNCYSSCGLRVIVDNNKVVNVSPLSSNLATPKGVCLKGQSYVERANSKERILYPHKRVGNGKFVRISWEEALNTISQKLISLKRDYGTQSVLYYAASGMSGILNEISGRFWRNIYGGVTTVYGNLCWPAGLEATRLTLGENKHNVPWDLENAKLIVLWGKNPAESNIHEMFPLGQALDNGAKLIVIDPRRTESSQRAELLLQPYPSTDAALALAIANILIRNGWIDKEFIAKYVSGFDEFKDHVQQFTTEWASKITGVSVELIEKLAWNIGNIKPMTLIPGYGMQRYTNGGQSVRALLALSVITGNIGKPGACWHYANLQSYVFDDVLEPLCYYPPEQPDGITRRSISTARLGVDMLNAKSPELKMIWVERGNPLTQNPDTNNVLKAFRALDFRVVVEQFFTDTALEADIVLPAKNMFEQTDIIGSYWNPYVQLRQKVVEPAGEVKPETEIYYLLAQKLGYTEVQLKGGLLPPGDNFVEDFLNEKLAKFPILSLDALRQGPILAPGLQEIAFSNFKFDTPTGKIELYSKQAKDKWGVNPLPTYEPALEIDDELKNDFPLLLMSPNTKNKIHSQFGNLEIIKMVSGPPTININPSDAQQRGIKNGDKVEVFNSRGRFTLAAELSYQVRVGCVVIPNGWWRTQGAPVNALSVGRETDMGHGSAFHNNRVEVKRVNRK